MLPINLDLARVRVVLVGDGAAACRRLALLDRAGAADLEVYAPDPAPELAAAAGRRLRRRLPESREIARAQLVFVAGVPEAAADRLRRVATSAGVLLNVEDDIARSEFHSPAVVRRGDLTVAVSTNGKSPGLAAAIRRDLEQYFDADWAGRLDRLAIARGAWRTAGIASATIARWTAQWLSSATPSSR
jgi:precorrin-2 dehydrogenase/sirohydrochlorin ferrochelatase